MFEPRRRMFGPLFYSTLVVALLTAIYAATLNAPDWCRGIARAMDQRRMVASLAEALRSPDGAARERAARLLRTVDSKASWPILRDAAHDPRGDVRARAYHLLIERLVFERLGEPSEVFPLLAEAAAEGDETVRLEAAIGLGRLAGASSMFMNARRGPAASTGLTPERRDEALRALRHLLKDPSSGVRAEAAGALGQFGRDPAIAADLAGAVRDADHAVRFAAAKSLAVAGGPEDPTAARTFVAIVASPDALPDRLAAVQAARGMSEAVQDRAVSALMDLLSRGDPDIVPDVIACLPEAGPRAKAAVPALEAMLDHPEPALRAAATMAIVAIESPEIVQAPRQGMSAGMGGMMGGAPGGGMMAMMGGPAGAGGTNPTPARGPANSRVAALLGRVVGDPAIPMEVRRTALAMIEADGPSAVAKVAPALVRQLADPDPAVRRDALALLSLVVELAPVDLPAASPPAK